MYFYFIDRQQVTAMGSASCINLAIPMIIWAVLRAFQHTCQKVLFMLIYFDYPVTVFMVECLAVVVTVQCLKLKGYVVFKKWTNDRFQETVLFASGFLFHFLFNASTAAHFMEGACESLVGLIPIATIWLGTQCRQDPRISRRTKFIGYLSSICVFLARFSTVLNIEVGATVTSLCYGVVNVLSLGVFLTRVRKTNRKFHISYLELAHDTALFSFVNLFLFNLFHNESGDAFQFVRDHFDFPRILYCIFLVAVTTGDVIFFIKSATIYTPLTMAMTTNAMIAGEAVFQYLSDISYLGDVIPTDMHAIAALGAILAFLVHVRQSM